MRKLLIALLAMAFVSMVIPAEASDSMSIQLHAKNANIWFFHYGKSITWYVMEVWPSNFLLTKVGPPTFSLNDNISLTVAAGPDFSVTGKEIFQSFTVDAVPVVYKGGFLGVFVNESGITKDGRINYYFRHTVTLKNVGLRWSGSGLFGDSNKHLQIGPIIKYQAAKKLSLEGWFSVNPHNGEKSFELAFNIVL